MRTRTIGELAFQLRQKYKKLSSWRTVAIECNVITADGRPDPSLAQRIASKGYSPCRLETRTRLGLDPIATVILIGEGIMPDFSQTIQAAKCSCGQFFISNHPRRKHCFLCRPFRQRKEKAFSGNMRPYTPSALVKTVPSI